MGESVYTRANWLATSYVYIFNSIAFLLTLSLSCYCCWLLAKHSTIFSGVFLVVCVFTCLTSLFGTIGLTSKRIPIEVTTLIWSLLLFIICLFCFTMLIFSFSDRLSTYVTKFDRTSMEHNFFSSIKTTTVHTGQKSQPKLYPRERLNAGIWFSSHPTIMSISLISAVVFQLIALVSWFFIVCGPKYTGSVITGIEFQDIHNVKLKFPGSRSIDDIGLRNLQNRPELEQFRFTSSV